MAKLRRARTDRAWVIQPPNADRFVSAQHSSIEVKYHDDEVLDRMRRIDIEGLLVVESLILFSTLSIDVEDVLALVEGSSEDDQDTMDAALQA